MRYKVLKDCIHPLTCKLIEAGDEFGLQKELVDDYLDALERESFIEIISDEPETVYDLKYGDECFMIVTSSANTCPCTIKWDKCFEPYREIGDIFLTKEETYKEIERRKAREILRRDAKNFRPFWGDDGYKWFVTYNHNAKVLQINFCISNQTPDVIYFSDEECVKKSIEVHEKEWLTILGIKG